jgi:hypothetical protein
MNRFMHNEPSRFRLDFQAKSKCPLTASNPVGTTLHAAPVGVESENFTTWDTALALRAAWAVVRLMRAV